LKESKGLFDIGLVIIPALVAQIDGIQTEYKVKWGFTYDTRRRKWRDPSGNEVDGRMFRQIFKDQAHNNQQLIFPIDDLAIEALFDNLFETTLYSTPSSTDLSRHKILHGERKDYGSMANVIRVFLYLDFLSSLEYRTNIQTVTL
jgi:hypothetical protein